ncbi:PAS domain S-box protein [Patescibacteria group bacterium]|nr:PAS domain S-box protein [Patescibacteria group bacterium]
MQYFFIGLLAVGAVSSWAYVFFKVKLLKADLILKEEGINNKMYELAILKELGDRVGYSLDIHQIVDIITGSLNQFIEYSAVSYMLVDPEKVLFKIHLEKSVHRGFVDDVKNRMLGSLSALLNKEFKTGDINEVLSGAILIEDVESEVNSFFNIPLVIGGKVVGILTVAHTEAGLYKEDEMTILYKITNQASKAVTRLQEVVSTEQRKLNAMVESMDDGVVMTDLDYRILVINPAAKKAIGLEGKEEFSIFDFIDNLGGKFDIRGRLEESVKLKKDYSSERILLGDRFFKIFVFPVKNKVYSGQEEILGGVVIFHDITSQVEMEKIQKDFTSMLVHELRSPLDGIKRISSVLRNKKIKLEDEQYQEYLQMIFQNSSSMLNLVSDILDVSKLEAGEFVVKKRPSNIVEAVSRRISFYEISAKDLGVNINISFGQNIPETFSFDIEGIEHVLNNLISNALKFTGKNGEINLSVFVHSKGSNIQDEAKLAGYKQKFRLPLEEKKELGLVVLVSDTGIGIKEEGTKNIFKKFKQLDSNIPDSKKQKGTGLGLVISKGIIEGHGGEIGVVSEEGVGSTFFFTIPLE